MKDTEEFFMGSLLWGYKVQQKSWMKPTGVSSMSTWAPPAVDAANITGKACGSVKPSAPHSTFQGYLPLPSR